METFIYSGSGFRKTMIGSCESGNIYSGVGFKKTPIGSYGDGCIFEGSGWSKTIVGTYEGPNGGAAAAAFLLLLGAFSSPSQEKEPESSESEEEKTGTQGKKGNNTTIDPVLAVAILVLIALPIFGFALLSQKVLDAVAPWFTHAWEYYFGFMQFCSVPVMALLLLSYRCRPLSKAARRLGNAMYFWSLLAVAAPLLPLHSLYSAAIKEDGVLCIISFVTCLLYSVIMRITWSYYLGEHADPYTSMVRGLYFPVLAYLFAVTSTVLLIKYVTGYDGTLKRAFLDSLHYIFALFALVVFFFLTSSPFLLYQESNRIPEERIPPKEPYDPRHKQLSFGLVVVIPIVLIAGFIIGLSGCEIPFLDRFIGTGSSASLPDRQKEEPPDEYAVGNTIVMGRYEQDGDYSNGDEDIEWIILDRKGDSLLVISKYCLENIYYDENARGVSYSSDWETSTIRDWLNEYFFYTSFTDRESARIMLSDVKTSDSTGKMNDTQDYIFLLSGKEVEQYFPSREAKLAVQTKAAYRKGGGGTSTEYAEWWLRISRGRSQQATTVTNTGSVIDPGYQKVHSLRLSVRPAMWIAKGD